MSTKLREASLAAANWWADLLRGGPRMQNNGDGLQSAMLTILAARAGQSEDTDIDKFRDLLAAKIDARLDRSEYGCSLRVDYGPEDILAQAMDESGVRGMLPCKSGMNVTETKVLAYCGYRAPDRRVWPKDERVIESAEFKCKECGVPVWIEEARIFATAQDETAVGIHEQYAMELCEPCYCKVIFAQPYDESRVLRSPHVDGIGYVAAQGEKSQHQGKNS